MGHPTRPHRQYCMLTGQYMLLYLLFAVCSGLVVDWFQSETCSQSYDRDYELCFDWWFVWFRSLSYNTTGCVPLGFICGSTYSILKLAVPQTAILIYQHKQPHLMAQTKYPSTCCNVNFHCLMLSMTVSYCLRYPVICSINILNKTTRLSNTCNTSSALF